MSFSPRWLALREPADHAARSAVLLAHVAQHFAQHGTAEVVDLGCGAGSNLRAVAPVLPARQRWHLVDHDPLLLEAARERLAAWADEAAADGDLLLLRKGDRRLAVGFVRADLTAGLEEAIPGEADLVTAAALFDLVSRAWIDAFAAMMAQRRLPLYAVLTYDGRASWDPAHPADAAMLAAFNAHQRTDKGFGPSAGPEAAAALAEAFAAAGYRVRRADSPWRLGPHAPDLRRALAAGFAEAVRETGLVAEAEIAAWRTAGEAGRSCVIGHEDLFAVPA